MPPRKPPQVRTGTVAGSNRSQRLSIRTERATDAHRAAKTTGTARIPAATYAAERSSTRTSRPISTNNVAFRNSSTSSQNRSSRSIVTATWRSYDRGCRSSSPATTMAIGPDRCRASAAA